MRKATPSSPTCQVRRIDLIVTAKRRRVTPRSSAGAFTPPTRFSAPQIAPALARGSSATGGWRNCTSGSCASPARPTCSTFPLETDRRGPGNGRGGRRLRARGAAAGTRRRRRGGTRNCCCTPCTACYTWRGSTMNRPDLAAIHRAEDDILTRIGLGAVFSPRRGVRSGDAEAAPGRRAGKRRGIGRAPDSLPSGVHPGRNGRTGRAPTARVKGPKRSKALRP